MSIIVDKIKERRQVYYLSSDENKLFIFHGSRSIIRWPSVNYSCRCSEYGPGFYAFLHPTGACAHRGRYSSATINMYSIDLEKLETNIDVIIDSNYNLNVYDKSTGITNNYNDILLTINGGYSSFVSRFGGQFYTRRQDMLDNYTTFIIGTNWFDFVVYFDYKSIEHKMMLRDYIKSEDDLYNRLNGDSYVNICNGCTDIRDSFTWKYIIGNFDDCKLSYNNNIRLLKGML